MAVPYFPVPYFPSGITFYGGEPLLNVGLIGDALDYFERSYPEYEGHTVASITTNGTLLTEAALEVLAEHGVGLLISLDGPEHMHDRFARFGNGEPSFKTVVEGIQRLERYEDLHGVEIRHRLIAVHSATSDIRELVRFATDTVPVLFKRTRYARISNINSSHANNLGAELSRASESTEAYDELRRQFIQGVVDGAYIDSESDAGEMHFLELLFAETFRELYQRKGQGCVSISWPDKLYPGSSCLFGQRKVHVNIDGKLLPCERCEDQFDYFDCGSLSQGFDIDKIHKNMCEYAACTAEMCKDCWIVRFCGTTCPAVLCVDNRLDTKRKAEECERARSRFSSCMRVMLEVMEQNPSAWRFLEKYHAV